VADLSAFLITRRWPPSHPDRLQLYSLNTPNGVKVSIMLEETGLAYEPHLIDIMANESHLPEFLSLNPNGKIPAIIDRAGRRAAGPVRIRGDPDLSGGEDRPVPAR
jgi:GST-like protein